MICTITAASQSAVFGNVKEVVKYSANEGKLIINFLVTTQSTFFLWINDEMTDQQKVTLSKMYSAKMEHHISLNKKRSKLSKDIGAAYHISVVAIF